MPAASTQITTPAYLGRFAEFYRRRGTDCHWLNNTLWVEQNRIISPLGPVNVSYAISDNEARRLLSCAPRAFLVRSTGGFQDGSSAMLWYAVVCRRFTELNEYSSKRRSEIRRGLRECRAEKIDARRVAETGYKVYLAAQARYGSVKQASPTTEAQFRNSALVATEFTDIVDFWGVYHNDQLVGLARNDVFGSTEVNYTWMVFDPDSFRFYSSYALIYAMNQHYLRDRGIAYANDGFRTVLHATDFQEFLIQKFAFERVYLELFVHYRSWLSMIMRLPKGLRHVLGQRNAKFAALNAIHEARSHANPIGSILDNGGEAT